jgi:hypothetical protein
VEAGVSFDLLQYPQTELQYLTECWLVSLRRFCAEFDISIRCLHNHLPFMARRHNFFLMDQALLLNFKRQELIDVNLVRTFLQVTTLSDIVSADGHFISLASWNGEHIPDRHSRIKFARQMRPTVYQRGLWRRLLRSFLVPHSKASDLRLNTPLGPWIQPSNMIWGAMMWEDAIYRQDPHVNSGERSVSVHYPQHLAHTNGQPASCIFYDAIPDWYTATIPRMAIPTDLTGNKFFWQHFRPSSTILFQRLPGRLLY